MNLDVKRTFPRDGVRARIDLIMLMCLTLGLTLDPARAGEADGAGLDIRASAGQAYRDVTRRFWRGSALDGRPVVTSHDGSYATADAPEIAAQKGWFWEYAMNIHFVWSYWRATGSQDAHRRLKASWTWVRKTWRDADFARCGVGTTSTAQDDGAWGAAALGELYEATGDPRALADEKSLLDCLWTRWRDDRAGGGLWYSDERKEKSSYQAPYVVAMLDYFAATGDRVFFERARELTDWANRTLRRPDGIYWEGVDADGQPLGAERPEDIHEAGSVTFLAGNMAWAVANARLFKATGAPAYREFARAAVEGVLAKETSAAGVLIDDRDAFVNGWAAYRFVTEAAPLAGSASKWPDAMASTAKAIATSARGDDGTYRGCWSQAPSCVWETNRSTRYQTTVSVNAAMILVAASARK